MTTINRAGHSSSSLSVGTVILYGIFVSEKSYLIGKRCMEKRDVYMLVGKAVRSHTLPYLPAELVDMIAERLYILEKAEVKAAWKKEKSFMENREKFTRYDKQLKLLPAQVAVLDKTVSLRPVNISVEGQLTYQSSAQESP